MNILPAIIFLVLLAAASVQPSPSPRSKIKSRYFQTPAICSNGSVVTLRSGDGSRTTHNLKKGRNYYDPTGERGALTKPGTDFVDDPNLAFRKSVRNNLQKRPRIVKQDQTKSRKSGETIPKLSPKQQIQRGQEDREWIPGVTCPWGQPPGYWCDDRLRYRPQEDEDPKQKKPPNNSYNHDFVGGGGIGTNFYFPGGQFGFAKTFHVHYHNHG